MKKLVYICSILLLVMAACSDSDETLSNSLDFSSPYVITNDDPNDPVQHKVYQLYQEYSVPVFFKDTIQKKFITYDYKGNPVYQYETLDLRWRFSSYQYDVNYQVKSLSTQKEQFEALRFIEFYLQMVSGKMRPFCIYIVKSFEYDKTSSEEVPFLVGFRTLTLAGIEKEVSDANKQELCLSMIKTMVLDKVKQHEDVVARFTYISQKDKWYGLRWKGTTDAPGLACSYKYIDFHSFLNPSFMFTKEQTFFKDVKSIIFDNKSDYTDDKAREIRRNIMKDIGRYGFICGAKSVGSRYSPDPEFDLKFFVETMLATGDKEFKARYGESPLVMQKYQILYDCIVNELGVNLNIGE